MKKSAWSAQLVSFRLWSRAISFVLTLGIVAPAFAQEVGDTRARLHFEAGAAAFDEGDYEAAIREFRSSYELSHRPLLLFNLAAAYERIGEFSIAADHLGRYLSESSEPANRIEVERRIGRLRERAASAEADTAPAPTHHAVPTTPPASAVETEIDPVPALIAYAFGVAGFGTFGVMGGLGLAEHDRLAASCGVQGCLEEDLADMRTFGLAADIGLGVGIAGAAAGTLLLFLVRRDVGSSEPAARAASHGFAMAPFVGVGSFGASARGRF